MSFTFLFFLFLSFWLQQKPIILTFSNGAKLFSQQCREPSLWTYYVILLIITNKKREWNHFLLISEKSINYLRQIALIFKIRKYKKLFPEHKIEQHKRESGNYLEKGRLCKSTYSHTWKIPVEEQLYCYSCLLWHKKS